MKILLTFQKLKKTFCRITPSVVYVILIHLRLIMSLKHLNLQKISLKISLMSLTKESVVYVPLLKILLYTLKRIQLSLLDSVVQDTFILKSRIFNVFQIQDLLILVPKFGIIIPLTLESSVEEYAFYPTQQANPLLQTDILIDVYSAMKINQVLFSSMKVEELEETQELIQKYNVLVIVFITWIIVIIEIYSYLMNKIRKNKKTYVILLCFHFIFRHLYHLLLKYFKNKIQISCEIFVIFPYF